MLCPVTHCFWGLFAKDEVACGQDDEDKESSSQGEGRVDEHVAEAGVMPVEACRVLADGNHGEHLRLHGISELPCLRAVPAVLMSRYKLRHCKGTTLTDPHLARDHAQYGQDPGAAIDSPKGGQQCCCGDQKTWGVLQGSCTTRHSIRSASPSIPSTIPSITL